MTKKRLKRNKKRSMARRMISGKKPMSPEQKKARKKLRDSQSQASKISKSK